MAAYFGRIWLPSVVMKRGIRFPLNIRLINSRLARYNQVGVIEGASVTEMILAASLTLSKDRVLLTTSMFNLTNRRDQMGELTVALDKKLESLALRGIQSSKGSVLSSNLTI